MAILDRPLFKKKLTKNQLRQYGIPAFANGGIVVQRFNNGGSANPFGIDLGYTESGAISSKPIFNPLKGLSLEEYEKMTPEQVLNFYQEVDQTRVPSKIKNAEKIDRLFNVLRSEGPDLPGFMEELRKPEMTQPITGLEFQQAAEKQLGQGEEQEKALKEIKAVDEVDDVNEEINLLEKTIEYKEANGIDASKDKENLKNKKSELKDAEDNLKSIKETPATKKDDASSAADAEGGTAVDLDSLLKEKTDTLLKEKTNTTITADTTDNFQGDKGVSDERTQMAKLQDIIKERSALYKELLGNPKEQLKQQGFLQLAQFGLNLAAARGGNLAEKIAKSATDPLQTFAALARDAAKDERAIELAAIESGEAQILKEIENQGDLSTIGKSVRDIARIQNIPINEAYGVYENLLKDEEKVTSFDRFVSAQDAQTIPNNVQAARASGSIPQSLLLDLNNFVAEDGNFDKKLITEQYNLGEAFKFQDSETGQVFMGIPKDSSLRDKKKKTLTFDDDPNKSDFIILKDIEVFSF